MPTICTYPTLHEPKNASTTLPIPSFYDVYYRLVQWYQQHKFIEIYMTRASTVMYGGHQYYFHRHQFMDPRAKAAKQTDDPSASWKFLHAPTFQPPGHWSLYCDAHTLALSRSSSSCRLLLFCAACSLCASMAIASKPCTSLLYPKIVFTVPPGLPLTYTSHSIMPLGFSYTFSHSLLFVVVTIIIELLPLLLLKLLLLLLLQLLLWWLRLY